MLRKDDLTFIEELLYYAQSILIFVERCFQICSIINSEVAFGTLFSCCTRQNELRLGNAQF